MTGTLDAVERTALLTAALRAAETGREDRLYSDPYAARLAGDTGPELLGEIREVTFAGTDPRIVPSTPDYNAIRTRFFDDFLQRAAHDPQMSQVVLAPAGMDSRAYRLDWPAHTRCFEVDRPAVLAFKEERLRGVPPRVEHRTVALDLTTPDWEDTLVASGYDPARPSVWLLEGLLYYIRHDDVHRILDRVAALMDAGAELLDLTEALPASVRDRSREADDDELVALACRRNVFELLLYRAVRELPHVHSDRNVVVRDLVIDPSTDRVRAVVTAGGERIPADVVIDATGRRAQSRNWLAGAGIPVADDRTAPSALTGFSRQYRLHGSERPGPLNRGNAVGGIWDHYVAALHPADNGTFAIAVMVGSGDPAGAGLREPAAFTTVARGTPGIGPWLAPGVSEPLTPVNVITCPPNVLRGTATARRPAVAGLFAVGDAACVTNPLYGRGMSLALRHAFALAGLLGGATVDHELSRDAARLAEQVYAPWYRFAAQEDGRRTAQWNAATGGEPAAPPAGVLGPLPAPEQLRTAMLSDAFVWRTVTRTRMGLRDPAEAFADETFLARVRQAPPAGPALPPRALSREELLHAVRTTEGAA
ncbi:SAM-dependent methyltransferase [Streptomyces lydicus]|uniref:SAM-dependent methyltransferase n=1 Tax=Streptomyces lydicus TaxID=47763 RepID=UPI0019D6BFD0|nr:SAM-dependent methyltransferase [Streptomyces lydicus]